MTVYICGNSHVGAIRRGFSELYPKNNSGVTVFPLGNGSHERNPFSCITPDGIRFTVEIFAQNLKQSTGQDTIAGKTNLWGICLGTQTLRFYNNIFWKNAEPAVICESGKQPVSAAAIDAIVENEQRYVRAFFSQLHDLGISVFAISGAPARLDFPLIERGVRRETIHYIDQAARTSLARWLADRGIDFITPPPECQTEDCFLKPQFNHVLKKGGRDIHHANSAYGKIMVTRLMAYLAQKSAL